ncbi:uncharacterized protein TNCV_2651411 [Trichonephila clavipes]|nr:uncharacterized protein TNCV_2651411 [Trichonephila clavipes]
MGGPTFFFSGSLVARTYDVSNEEKFRFHRSHLFAGNIVEIVRIDTSPQVFVSGSNLYTGGIFVDGSLKNTPLHSDEAHFWLNGYVNKQNCRIWSEANPKMYVETPLHPEKLTVWCALWAGGILLQKRCRPQRYSQW